MQQILRDMLIWLLCFFGISAALLFLVRWSVQRFRRQRAERLRLLETRFRESSDGLGLPLIWVTASTSSRTTGDAIVSLIRWLLSLGLLAAGIAWSVQAPGGWDWIGVVLGASSASIIFGMLSLWLYCRRVSSMPAKIRHLAAAIRWWTIRLANGMDRRTGLEHSAKQLQRFDPELARCLEIAAVSASSSDRDAIQRAFYPCGTGVAERLADILSGKIPDSLTALRTLADQLDRFYQNQLLVRVKSIDGWLKYPIVLCLLPAINLLMFGPAVANLIDNFGVLKIPATPAVPGQPLEPQKVPSGSTDLGPAKTERPGTAESPTQ